MHSAHQGSQLALRKQKIYLPTRNPNRMLARVLTNAGAANHAHGMQ